jgi:hypothetical protein
VFLPPQSARAWVDYFEANAAALLDVPWERGAELSEAERSAVAGSLPAFQVGESSEGRNLIRAAEDHARQTGDPDYLAAVRLFIREEQRHARDLGRFLDLAGVPRLTACWTDGVFRWLRRRAGLELTISVLLVAEVIALVYYAALRAATGSAVLRRLCDQVLRDEVEHVRFHCERLAMLRRDRPRWRSAFSRGLHRVFFAGTCLVVWWDHAALFRAAGCSLLRFWAESWYEMSAALARTDPRAYGLPAVPSSLSV